MLQLVPGTFEAAKSMRAGAERLRQIAATEGDSQLGREMLQIADEMDKAAAELERSAGSPPKPPIS
jgi:hypothetical protein